MTEREKMLAGEPYDAGDPELLAGRRRARRLTTVYNALTDMDEDTVRQRGLVLAELLGALGPGGFIEPPFRCDYGANIYIGRGFYANYDCIMLDVAEIRLGDGVLLGPRVGLYTAGHPLGPAERRGGLEYGRPITIGDNVWVGGDATVLPGVSIGDNTVVGAGSVVAKSLPAGVLAVGNPCRVVRVI